MSDWRGHQFRLAQPRLVWEEQEDGEWDWAVHTHRAARRAVPPIHTAARLRREQDNARALRDQQQAARQEWEWQQFERTMAANEVRDREIARLEEDRHRAVVRANPWYAAALETEREYLRTAPQRRREEQDEFEQLYAGMLAGTVAVRRWKVKRGRRWKRMWEPKDKGQKALYYKYTKGVEPG